MHPKPQSDIGATRLILITSFNSVNFASILAKDESLPRVAVTCAPYGNVMQTLLNPGDERCNGESDGAVVWTSPESISVNYQRLSGGEDVDAELVLADVDRYSAAVKRLASRVKYVFLPTWTVGPYEGRLGMLDMHAQRGPSLMLMRMNVRLAESLREDKRVVLLDASRWLSVHGEKSWSDRLWYMSKTPYTIDLFRIAALEVKSALAALAGRARKLILLDLDDTLWGGVVGDAGWQHLRLGGHDATGEAFKDFQLALKRLKQQGILLGLVSKNEESTALEAIRSHPEMVLREDDFAGWRINWEDKARNVAELVAELNLGLQSAVFIDDNPLERARVRDSLPEVLVPEWPGSPMDYKAALQRLRCFDKPHVSAEDQQRSEAYVAERKRRASYTPATDLEEWLASLGIEVAVVPVDLGNLDRVEQLLNKTNQMNLSTRRLTKQEIWGWSQQPGNRMLTFRVADKYGDYGLVGIGSLAWQGGEGREAVLVDFILSCRAMGRKVEETMLHVLSVCAKSGGAARLVATFVPTPKNQPCLRFFESTLAARDSSGQRFTFQLQEILPKPPLVGLVLNPLADFSPPSAASAEKNEVGAAAPGSFE